MSEKSYVCIQTLLCPICLSKVDEQLLLHKHLRKTLENHSVLGNELCESCKSRREEYIAIIEATGPDEDQRTGRVLHVRRTAMREIVENPSDERLTGAAIRMHPETIKLLFGHALKELESDNPK